MWYNGWMVTENAGHAEDYAEGEDPYRTWYVGDLADTRVRAGEDKS